MLKPNLPMVTWVALAASFVAQGASQQVPAANSDLAGPPLVRFGAPAPSSLQDGDLLWPKKPGAFVPFNSKPGEASEEEQQLWQKQLASHLEMLREQTSIQEVEAERYRILQDLSYEEFAAHYLDDRILGEPVAFGSGSFYVGHVAMVQLVEGVPTVIEALLRDGVRRVSYAEWLDERQGELIWWGRLSNLLAEERERIAQVAASQISKPYNFWLFDLADTDGFYCSKLVWYSVMRGVGLALDDNPKTNRSLWYSPKRLMRSRHVELLSKPGNYSHKQEP